MNSYHYLCFDLILLHYFHDNNLILILDGLFVGELTLGCRISLFVILIHHFCLCLLPIQCLTIDN